MYGETPQKPVNVDPEYDCGYGWTVAMLLAYNGIIPPKEWIHDPNIKNKRGDTVAYYLKKKNLPVSNKWYDESMKDKERNPDFIE